MKNVFIIFFVAALLFSCSRTPDEVQLAINKLKFEERTLIKETQLLSDQIDTLELKISVLNEKYDIYKSIAEGRKIHYIVMLEIGQSHFLDVNAMIKDEMNKIKLPIEVSERFYNSVKVGEKLSDEFRMGSFLLEGSFGSWDIKIIDKKIATEK